MRITQINKGYVVQTDDGETLQMLNRKSLIWNLKNVFRIKGEAGKAIMKSLDTDGVAVVAA